MKKAAGYLVLFLAWCWSSSTAEIINGTVIDSADNKPIFHAIVSLDSTHSVQTDSSGKFSINTGGVGVLRPEVLRDVVVPVHSGEASIQVRNTKGTLVAQSFLENISTNTTVSLAQLPQGVYIISAQIAGKMIVQKTVNITSRSNQSTRLIPHNDGSSTGSFTIPCSKTAATALTFSKSAYFSKIVAGPVSGSTVKMSQNFTASRHDFIYAGEWQNGGFANQKFFVYRGGKQVFSYTYPQQCEYGDIWMLSNGNIVYSYRWGAAEMTGTGTETWNWADPLTNPARPQADVHTAQPLGLDRVMVYSNGEEGLNITAKIIIINTRTKQQERVWVMPGTGGSHNQSRHARMTKAGTLLVAHQDLQRIAEYDTATGKEIWKYSCGTYWPWDGVRLRSGNTLVSGNDNGWIRIVNPAGTIVWEFTPQNCPPPAGRWFFQEVSMLDNGNVIACNQQADPNAPGLLEISVTTPPKIVWSVLGKDLPGGISTCQILDDPGVPENRDLQR
jgi:hypothetical protein